MRTVSDGKIVVNMHRRGDAFLDVHEDPPEV
jgi:hypothetical protein